MTTFASSQIICFTSPLSQYNSSSKSGNSPSLWPEYSLCMSPCYILSKLFHSLLLFPLVTYICRAAHQASKRAVTKTQQSPEGKTKKWIQASKTGRQSQKLIRALRRKDVRMASGWRQDSVRMASGLRQDGVSMASGWPQDGVRMRQDGRQDAVWMMGSLASGWRQIASGCVRMVSTKRQNSVRMASGSIRVASGWRQGGVRIL